MTVQVNNPRVSICLPVFNGERYLAAAIESALGQAFESFELVISDDSSTDQSHQIIEGYAARDTRIKYLRNSSNLGLFANYNRCIQAAGGDYIKPFAQDDLLGKNAIGKLVEVLESKPEVALIASSYTRIDESDTNIDSKDPKPRSDQYFASGAEIPGREVIKQSLLPVVNFIGPPSAVMFRKKHVGGGFDPTFHHIGDLEFWFRILSHGMYFHLDQELCSFRVHELGTTTFNCKFFLHAPDLLRIGRKYKSLVAEAGGTLSEFNDLVIMGIAHDIKQRGAGFKKGLHDREPEFLSEFNHQLRERSLQLPPVEMLELALQALIRIPLPSTDHGYIISGLEKQVRDYLSSRSWRVTRFLREANQAFAGSDDSEIAVYSARAVDQVDEQRTYERWLRKQLWRVKHSRSWALTKPIRWIEKWLDNSQSQLQPPPVAAAQIANPVTEPAKDSPSKEEVEFKVSDPHRPQADMVSRTQPDRSYHRPTELATRTIPSVSVIMPTWNRARVIGRAIESLLAQSYSNWECIIVDDGSTDDTTEVLSPYLQDPRFAYFHQTHTNCSTARNLGLSNAKGEIIAYLDTDNVWLPQYLSGITEAFGRDTDVNAVYASQIVQERHDSSSFFLRCETYDQNKLSTTNFIDLNVFAHRKELVDRLGGFDEKLDSLTDWDLILRYGAREKIKVLPLIGGVYFCEETQESVTSRVAQSYSRYLIESKDSVPAASRLKVLYALWHYPQLSESYIEFEIRAVRKLGVDVEVWSESGVAFSYPVDIPVHRGTLEEALDKVKPDLVHTHWMLMAKKFEPLLRKSGLPMTVRSHGFEFADEYGPLLDDLDRESVIRAVYLFPHHAASYADSSQKIKSLPISFDPDLYRPQLHKDRKLVIRTGTGLTTKDYRCFMEAAKLCPQHRFLLVLAAAYTLEDYIDEIVSLNRSLGSPVELRVNLQYDEVSKLVAEAGIYMHTTKADRPFGMPISIAEAMATGCYLLLRRRPETYAFAKDVAAYYDNAEDAAQLITQTLRWNDEDWADVHRRTVERAYGNFVSSNVLKSLVSNWQEISTRHKMTGEDALVLKQPAAAVR